MYSVEFLVDRKEKNPVNGVAIHKGITLIKYRGTRQDSFYTISGGWGNGPLPFGLYRAENIRILEDIEKNFPFKKEGFPWFMNLQPQFSTERKDLGLHADGNVPGSEGCAVITQRDIAFYCIIKGILSQLAIKYIDFSVKEYTP